MRISRKTISVLFWPALAVITLGLRALAGYFPQATEQLYSRGIFVAIRYIWDYSIGLFPIPIYYLLLGALLFFLVKKIKRLRQQKKRLTLITRKVFSFIGFAICSFFLLWGFNYARLPLAQQIHLKPPVQASDSLRNWLIQETEKLLYLRQEFPVSIEDSITSQDFPSNITPALRNSLEAQLRDWKIPTPGMVKAKAISPKGVLIGLGATGIYLPWTGQGQYDASLHPLERAVTAAHEMGHAFGFTDEGECNFLGYLACIQSEEPLLRYAGQLAVWRALARSAYAFDTELYHLQYGKLPTGIRADLTAIRQRQKRYRAWFPDLSRAIYDRYLKGQGVQGGVASYSRGVLLWEAYLMSSSQDN